jgi:hypothetical protein
VAATLQRFLDSSGRAQQVRPSDLELRVFLFYFLFFLFLINKIRPCFRSVLFLFLQQLPLRLAMLLCGLLLLFFCAAAAVASF